VSITSRVCEQEAPFLFPLFSGAENGKHKKLSSLSSSGASFPPAISRRIAGKGSGIPRQLVFSCPQSAPNQIEIERERERASCGGRDVMAAFNLDGEVFFPLFQTKHCCFFCCPARTLANYPSRGNVGIMGGWEFGFTGAKFLFLFTSP